MPADGDGLFSRSDAHAAGWTDDAIAHAIRTGRWRRVAAGIYRVPDTTDAPEVSPTSARDQTLLRGIASQRTCPRGVISHAAAAIAWDLPTVCDVSRPCVTVPAGTALHKLADVHLHRATLPSRDVVSVQGSRTTAVARTVADLAREHGVDAGVAAADAALHLGLVRADDLAAAVAACAGWPGSSAVRKTVALADPLAESPLESLSRLRMQAANVPAPELQVAIGDEWGGFVARVDFYWPEFGVVGEADGNLKYRDRTDLVEERRRQRRLESLGLVVVRWEWADLARFDRVARELSAAFARGIRRGAGRRWAILPALHPGSALSPRW